MSGSLFQQVITLLTTPPGNLVYHLVLAFSIAGALPGALNLWQRGAHVIGKRMVIGLALLLLAQLILIFDAALTQFFPIISDWLPILDRAVTAFSLVILIWIWVFPEPSRRADTATLLLSLLILVLTIFTGIWWLNQPSKTFFNGSLADLFWTGFSLVFALAGGILLLIRKPNGYGIGLSMFVLLFLGQLLYRLSPVSAGSFQGIVRLTQIAAYPLLLTLPYRYSFGSAAAIPGERGIDPGLFQQFVALITSADPQDVCQRITITVAHALSADLCLLISPPDENNYFTLECGYDLTRNVSIGPATFDGQLIPVLSESLRQGRRLHLPADGNIPDLVGLGKVLDLSLTGSLLSAPIFTAGGDLNKVLVLLSPVSKRTWTADDQNYLADIANSLTDVFQIKKETLLQQVQFTQSKMELHELRSDKDIFSRELEQTSHILESSSEQIQRLQTQLYLASQEIAESHGTGVKEQEESK
jgi:hypothetical protein